MHEAGQRCVDRVGAGPCTRAWALAPSGGDLVCGQVSLAEDFSTYRLARLGPLPCAIVVTARRTLLAADGVCGVAGGV